MDDALRYWGGSQANDAVAKESSDRPGAATDRARWLILTPIFRFEHSDESKAPASEPGFSCFRGSVTNVRIGSNSEVGARDRHVRFPPR